MATIFTKIISKEIPSYTLVEDENFIAFLDVNPNALGHTLCVPKQEVDRIFDLDEEEYIALMRFSRKIAKALKKAIPCKRIGIAVIGLEVPHVHVHLVPLNDMKEMTFQHKVQLSTEEFEDIQKQIQKAL